MSATLFSQNLIRMSNIKGVRDGPLCKQSWSDTHDSSSGIRSLRAEFSNSPYL